MPFTQEEEDVEVPTSSGLALQSHFGTKTVTATGTRSTTSESMVGGCRWLPHRQGSLGTEEEDPSCWSLGNGTPSNLDKGWYANVTN